jgi:hypothetical protein
MAGICVISEGHLVRKGNHSINIAVDHFPPGIYCLELAGNHGFVFREKIVISHY